MYFIWTLIIQTTQHQKVFTPYQTSMIAYSALYQTFILSMVPEMSVLFFSLPP